MSQVCVYLHTFDSTPVNVAVATPVPLVAVAQSLHCAVIVLSLEQVNDDSDQPVNTLFVFVRVLLDVPHMGIVIVSPDVHWNTKSVVPVALVPSTTLSAPVPPFLHCYGESILDTGT